VLVAVLYRWRIHIFNFIVPALPTEGEHKMHCNVNTSVEYRPNQFFVQDSIIVCSMQCIALDRV